MYVRKYTPTLHANHDIEDMNYIRMYIRIYYIEKLIID